MSNSTAITLLPCPHCGAPAVVEEFPAHSHTIKFGNMPLRVAHEGSFTIEGQCACGCGMIGATLEETAARWNKRTTTTSGPLSQAARDVLAERQRQIDGEGFAPREDRWRGADLAAAAGCYALFGNNSEYGGQKFCPAWWPFSVNWWKPVAQCRYRTLVKAGALLLAALESGDFAKGDAPITIPQPPTEQKGWSLFGAKKGGAA